MDSAESTDIIERLQYGVDVVQSPGRRPMRRAEVLEDEQGLGGVILPREQSGHEGSLDLRVDRVLGLQRLCRPGVRAAFTKRELPSANVTTRRSAGV
jgi:hypothetical protein